MYISAIIIQAYWRGFKVRNDAWYDKEGEKWFIWYENSAAKRIQRIWRGFKVRNDAWYDKEGEKWFIWYENSAAKRIQMIWRGYKSRQGWHTKPAIYSVLHIEHDKVWIIHQEGVFLKKTPSPSELPKPPEKWLIA